MNELNNSAQYIQDCVGWDVVNWSKAFRFWEKSLVHSNNLQCLELGGKKGGISLWLASKGHTVICSDIENSFMEAKALHKKYNVEDRVTYMEVDATHIPYENKFDIITFKSILGGISRNGNAHLNDVVINQILKALKPNGKLLFAENLSGSVLHMLARKKMTNWGSYWNYLRLEDIQKLLAGFDHINFSTTGFLGAFGRNESQRKILGTLDSLFFNSILPARMHYIAFGTVTKGDKA